MIISGTCDLVNSKLERRKANSPLENYIYQSFHQHINAYQNEIDYLVETILNEFDKDISYYSKKLIKSI